MVLMTVQNSDAGYVVGIDIGGTNFRIGAVDQNGALLASAHESSRRFFGGADAVQALGDYIDTFQKRVSGELRGICAGFPGTVAKDKSRVLSCPNLPAFTNVNVGRPLADRFGVPALAEHDVILLLENDMRAAGLHGQDCVMAVYLGTGLGNAMYIHGRFLDGKNGVSGELGHIPVLGSDAPCPCGNRGCIELWSSGKRLEQLQEEHFPALEDFRTLFTLHAGDPAIDGYLDCVATAIAAEINILDPDTVLLSGGVLNMPDFPYERLLDRIRLHTRKPYPAEALCFLRGVQDKYAGIRGATSYLWSRL